MAAGGLERWWTSPADPTQRVRQTVLAGCVGLVLFATLWGSFYDRNAAGIAVASMIIDIAAGLLALGLMLLVRRDQQLMLAWLVNILATISSLAAGAAVITLLGIASNRRPRQIVPLGVMAVTSTVVSESIISDRTETALVNVIFGACVVGLIICWGLYLGANREAERARALRARAQEHEQTMLLLRARDVERTRIAREMHDALAHRISLIALHSGAIGYRQDLTVEQLREGVGLIHESAQQALAELSGVLGYLSSKGSEATGLKPQPNLTDLPDLVSEAKAMGAPITLIDHVVESPPDWLGRQAYRIVQESITNAQKHAPGAKIVIELNGQPEGQLTVSVMNDAASNSATRQPLPTSGRGLIGLIERAESLGGSVEHGPTPAGGYAVRAWIPWTQRTFFASSTTMHS